MAGKINIAVEEDGNDPNEDPKLVERVDKMMDLQKEKGEDKQNSEEGHRLHAEQEAAQKEPAPLDIFADVPSAPLMAKPITKGIDSKTKKIHVKVHKDEAEEVDLAHSAQEEIAEDLDQANASNDPENYDDPVISQAIEDIVSHESDESLALNDQKLAIAEENAQPIERDHSHKIFWTFVILICIVAIAAAVFIIDPSLYGPLSKVHWSSIRRHL